MVYKIYPGCRIPFLVPGDICNIGGTDFKYLGEYANAKSVPYGLIGVYKNLASNSYELRHKQSDTAIIESYNNYMINQIANDPTPMPPERVVKEVFDPPITNKDNYLKIQIKQILHRKQLGINELRPRFSSDNHMNNMRRLLISDVNLTMEKYLEWLDILGFTFDRIVLLDENGEVFTPDREN